MEIINYDKKFLAQLKDNYFKSKVMNTMIKEQTEAIQQSILDTYEFYIDDEFYGRRNKRGFGGGGRTTRPFDSYLMKEDDFQRYLDLCYAVYKEAKIDHPKGREYCPEAEYYELMKKSESMLIDYAIEILPSNYTNEKETLRMAVSNLKYREKVLDLILSLETE